MWRPVWPWVILLACQLLQALSLLPWLAMAGFAVMAFDAPGSESAWQPWAFVLAVWSYPVWIVLAAAASWILLAKERRAAAVGVAVVFTLPLLAVPFLLLS